MMASISAHPVSSAMDEPVSIRVAGLQPRQAVTLTSSLKERQLHFQAHAHCCADETGTVDLTTMPATGGTYTGVEPMGLFWSLHTENPMDRLKKADLMQPFDVAISLLDGHQATQAQDSPLASTALLRYYAVPGVQRVTLREGRLRGTLFIPPGECDRHPAVIDLYGATGRLVENRAALLASRGFLTLALAYMHHEDFPTIMPELQLEYFEEAIEWLSNHKRALTGQVGMVGASKGGEMALQAAAVHPKVVAVVSINSFHFNSATGHTYKGQPFHCVVPNLKKTEMSAGIMSLRDGFMHAENINECLIQLQNSPCADFLLLQGGDDWIAHPQNVVRLADRLHRSGKTNFGMHIYPGAGHLMEPPYSPSTSAISQGVFKDELGVTEPVKLRLGGHRTQHAHAEEDAWNKILTFLKRRLTPPFTQASL